MALSFPPLQQKSTSSVARASLMARRIFHADAKLASERGIAQYVLILFVGEVDDAPVETDAMSQIVRAGEVKARIAWVIGQPQSQEIAIPPGTGEIPGEIPVHPPECRV